jgi:hypothetical protein
MELYSGTINTVEFEAPNSTVNVTAEYSLTTGPVTQIGTSKSPTENTIWNLTLPYLPEEGTVKVTWKFTISGTEYTKDEFYNVVTPYVSTRWIRKNLLEDATDEQIKAAESSARYIINAHTGQNFGRRNEKISVFGTGKNSVALPSRLISATTINGSAFNSSWYSITGDGWYLTHPTFGVPPVKADYYGLHEINGVIYNPYNVNIKAFGNKVRYEIDGTWGWENVPQEITEAAKLLINDYACNEGVYRDKYLTSMTAADWRIQFHSGAFNKTGNVRADQLLSDYVLKNGWMVV